MYLEGNEVITNDTILHSIKKEIIGIMQKESTVNYEKHRMKILFNSYMELLELDAGGYYLLDENET